MPGTGSPSGAGAPSAATGAGASPGTGSPSGLAHLLLLQELAHHQVLARLQELAHLLLLQELAHHQVLATRCRSTLSCCRDWRIARHWLTFRCRSTSGYRDWRIARHWLAFRNWLTFCCYRYWRITRYWLTFRCRSTLSCYRSWCIARHWLTFRCRSTLSCYRTGASPGTGSLRLAHLLLLQELAHHQVLARLQNWLTFCYRYWRITRYWLTFRTGSPSL